MPPRFSPLRERLLHAGIAPRHVRRYLAELCDPFDDLVREETAKGLERTKAEEAARARIGSDEQLAAVMLARPELGSLTARYPWAVFGVGPVVMLALVIVAAVLIQVGIVSLRPTIPRWSIPWMRSSIDLLNWLVMYAAPLAIAAGLGAAGIKQRMRTGWIVLGLAVICVVGGFHEIGVKWSHVRAIPSEFGVGLAFAPPFPRAMLISGFVRATVNLVLVGTIYFLWLRRDSSATVD